MKTFLALIGAAGLALSGVTAFSQAPVAPALPGAPANPQATLTQLKTIRDQNAKMLEQQAATLKQLEEMEKTSQTLKLLGKRS
jgi:hypothetical protein